MTRPVDVLAPCAGRALAMADAGDPVFAQEMVGPGIVVDPAPGPTVVVAPVAGTVVKVHPHAFVVLTASGAGVLVHLGINTVRLDGVGFEVLTEQGATVAAGDPMVRWDPSTIVPGDDTGRAITTLVPVVLMDRPPGSVDSDRVGQDVVAGQALFTI